MPAKRIIILERVGGGRVRYALWADVPVSRQPFYAQVGKVSAWKDASIAENTALATGQVAEFIDVVAIDGTIVQVRDALQARWQDFQTDIINSNPWVRYGTSWDGTTWVAAGVV